MNSKKLTLLLLCLTTSVGLPLYATPGQKNEQSLLYTLLGANQQFSDNDETVQILGSEKTQLLIGNKKTQPLTKNAHGYGSTGNSSSDGLTDDSSSDEGTPPITPPLDSNESNTSTSSSSDSESPLEEKIGTPGLRNPHPFTKMPSQEIRPDITLFMRKAYEGDWQYFKNLANGNLSLSEKLKNLIYLRNLTATDNNGRTVLHWALKSPKGPEKALTMHWLTKYLKNELKNDEFTQFFKLKNNKEQTVSDLIFEGYTQKPFKIEDPTTDTLPHLVYGLYLNNIAEPRLFYDMLAWAIARNKMKEVKTIMEWAFEDNGFAFDINAKSIQGTKPSDYAKTSTIKKLLKDTLSEYEKGIRKHQELKRRYKKACQEVYAAKRALKAERGY